MVAVNPQLIFETLMYGLATGGLYGLMALSLTLIWGVGKVWDKAQAGWYAMAGYATWIFMSAFNVPFPISIIIAGSIAALPSVGVERFLYRRMRGKFAERIIMAFGIYLLTENALLYAFGGRPKSIDVPYGQATWQVLGLSVPLYRLTVMAIAIGIFVALFFVFKTKTGKAMRASAQNLIGAELVGINSNRIFSIIFALSGFLTAVSCTLLLPMFAIFPGIGLVPMVKATIIIVIGGLGSVPGSIVGGLALGVTESFGAVFVSTGYVNTFGIFILIAILILRPFGLFGQKEEGRRR